MHNGQNPRLLNIRLQVRGCKVRCQPTSNHFPSYVCGTSVRITAVSSSSAAVVGRVGETIPPDTIRLLWDGVDILAIRSMKHLVILSELTACLSTSQGGENVSELAVAFVDCSVI